MIFSEVLNIIGILTLMFGGCLGLLSSFSESNQDIVHRTGVSFGNEEFYGSMISQKYLNISSFFAIVFGSLFLLLPILLSKSIVGQNIGSFYPMLILVFVILITLYFLIIIFIKKYSSYKVDQVTAYNQIEILSQKSNKIELSDGNLLILIEKLKKRKVITNFQSVDEIIKTSINYFKFDKKH